MRLNWLSTLAGKIQAVYGRACACSICCAQAWRPLAHKLRNCSGSGAIPSGSGYTSTSAARLAALLEVGHAPGKASSRSSIAVICPTTVWNNSGNHPIALDFHRTATKSVRTSNSLMIVSLCSIYL